MRRSISFVLSFVAVAALTAAVGLAPAEARQGGKPNIVYIVADDLGRKDVGFHGSDIKTPNIDRLAATGARLEQFYAQPMCTPSRAALMTGRYPHRYGLQTAVIPSAGKYGLVTDEWLLPQALKEAGYTTAIVGKWHLGHADRKYWPRQRGFDYQYGPLLGEIDYFTHAAHGSIDWFRNNQLVREPGYATTLLGKDAARLIENPATRQPFFLYLTFTAPHAPYQAPQEYLDRYKQIADPNRRAYAAMITAMDDEIGRVLDALDRRRIRENTLVVFQSDNGGPRSAKVTGEVNTSGGEIPADNAPYRDGKASLYEGGTRVVAVANWPGHIKPGVVDHPIHIVDMFPTLVRLAGASTAKCKPLDGMDVWPAISEGKPSPRAEVVYDIEPFRAAVRQGDWKLVWKSILPSRMELFNLAQDPAEKDDLAARHPEKVAELQKRIEALARESVQPLFMSEVTGTAWKVLTGSVALPGNQKEYELDP